MDTIQQKKEALRRELEAAERAMMPEEKRLSDSAILHHVLNTQEYRLARTVFAFVGRADEIDTRPLLEQILRDGKRLCVPLCTSPGVMECREVPDLAVLHPGAYGISEPPDNAPAVPPECGWRRSGHHPLRRRGCGWPPAWARRRLLRSISGPVYRRRAAAVPGKAFVSGYSAGNTRHPRLRCCDGAGAAGVGKRHPHPGMPFPYLLCASSFTA